MDIPVRWHLENGICDAYKAQRGGSSALHGHHHFLLTLITEGSGVQILNGEKIPFKPNDLFWLSPADFHENIVEQSTGFSYYGLKFSYELLDSRLAEFCAMASLPLHLRLPENAARRIRNIFGQLIEECEKEQEQIASRAYLQALVEQLIILILRHAGKESVVRSETLINRALGYLYTHFSEDITVADAAAYVGYTPNYFNACFSQQMGVPFGEYLRQMRLTYAENMLRSGISQITEVAYESGFGSLSYFSRCFREKYGISPKEYRQRYQVNKE